jgi:hypothetical protein
MPRSPAETSLRGRIGAAVLPATRDSRETTAAGRRAFRDRFEREVDPDGVLPPEERARRAKAAKTAYFSRLSLAALKARTLGPHGRSAGTRPCQRFLDDPPGAHPGRTVTDGRGIRFRAPPGT